MVTYEIASLTQANAPAGNPRLAMNWLRIVQAIAHVAKYLGVCAYYLVLAPFLIPFAPFVLVAWLLQWVIADADRAGEYDPDRRLPADIEEPAWQAGSAGTIPAQVTGYH